MKTFNAFQLTILLAVWPFLISFLDSAQFRWSGAAFYTSCALYFIQLCWTVYAYRQSFDEGR